MVIKSLTEAKKEAGQAETTGGDEFVRSEGRQHVQFCWDKNQF